MSLKWQDDALCAEVGPELFFPEKGESAAPAKSVCAACPVVAECLGYALSNRLTVGIYAGMTITERRDLLRGSAA